MERLNKHYLDYLKKYPDTDKLHIKWNWAAFLLGPIWIFYNGMYLYGATYFLLLFIAQAIKILLVPGFKIYILSSVMKIMLGIYGTALFCNNCKKEIIVQNAVKNKTDDEIISIDNYECKTRPILAVILFLFLYVIYNASHYRFYYFTSQSYQNMMKEKISKWKR